MKIKSTILGLLACAACVACSDNNEPTQPDNNKVLDGDAYVAVSILIPGNDTSRADEGDFEAGTEAENTVNNALFVFFDEFGNFSTAKAITSAELTPWSDGSNSVDKISSAVLVLQNVKSVPRSVVALLNTDLTETTVKDIAPTLTALKEKIADYSSTTNGFVMSNSVYDGVCDVVLTDENIQKSKEAAEANPVDIYVERVLAKIDVTEAKDLETTGETVSLNDGTAITETELKPSIAGYQVISTAKTSYLLKNIDNNTNWWSGWDDPANHRSYWANSAPQESGYTLKAYNEVTEGHAYTDYCLENTKTDSPTKLLVTAVLKDENGPVTLMKYNGNYYTEEGYKTLIAKALENCYYQKDTDASSNDWRDYIEIVKDDADDAKAWEVKAKLTDNAPAATEGDPEATLANLNSAYKWTDGYTYFYVDIEHFGTAPQNIGVVRNHIYQLEIASIKGLGTPVFDPTEVIDPEKPEDIEYNVAARINILKWKGVKQTVNLE